MDYGFVSFGDDVQSSVCVSSTRVCSHVVISSVFFVILSQ